MNGLKIGQRMHHMKYGETRCAKFYYKGLIKYAVGRNGIYAPVSEWIPLADPKPKEANHENDCL